METEYQKLVQNSILKIRQQLELRGNKTLRSLGRFFKQMQSFDSQQQVTCDEFFVSLRENLGLNISQQEANILMTYFDRDQNGKISIDEFLYCIREKMNQKRQNITEKVYQKLDSQNKGFLDKNEIRLNFNYACHPLFESGQKKKEQIIKEFIENFDADGDGIITKQEFFWYYDTVSASIDNDEHFILLMSMVWRI